MTITTVFELTVKITVESDLPDIFRIREDPLVKPNQYKMSRGGGIENWRSCLHVDNLPDGVVWRCWTIRVGDQIVGHVTGLHSQIKYGRSYHFGWNLAPNFWGRGIMAQALTHVLDDVFAEANVEAVVADCFESNERCIRLVQKLGFSPMKINWPERLTIWIRHSCPHKVLRNRLLATDWNARN